MRPLAPEKPANRPWDALRRAAVALMAVASVALIVASAIQILGAVYASPQPGPDVQCRPGIQNLLHAVTRATQRASATIAGEREALAVFRRGLAPEWDKAAEVRTRCEQAHDKKALRAFRTVELLRYAEERAVRYEALDLAAFRKKAPQLTSALLDD